jgi:membrane-associated phospholipid phosphatase
MTSLAVYKHILSRDWLYRWLVIAAAAGVAAIGASLMRFSLDAHRLRPILLVVFIFCAAGLVFAVLALRIRSLRFVMSACADFFLSVAQLAAFGGAGLILTYIAASANFPLMDEVFARLDMAMGFHWNAVSDWVQQHPAIQTVLWTAYGSSGVQLLGLLLVQCMRAPGVGTGELVWNFMVSLLIVTAISVFLPAAAFPGMIGQRHIDLFLAVRNGGVTVLDDKTITALITFPSFHAALGVICIYSARTMKWLLAVLAPLNLLVIIATVPCGGHYLIDTIAGLAVAAISILVVRKIRRSIGGQESNSASATAL